MTQYKTLHTLNSTLFNPKNTLKERKKARKEGYTNSPLIAPFLEYFGKKML